MKVLFDGDGVTQRALFMIQTLGHETLSRKHTGDRSRHFVEGFIEQVVLLTLCWHVYGAVLCSRPQHHFLQHCLCVFYLIL